MPERLSASVAARQITCHASADLPAAIPGWAPPEQPDTAASSDGTLKHKFLEESGAYKPSDQLALAKAMTYVAKVRMRRRFQQHLEAEGSGWWLKKKPRTIADVVLFVKDEIHILDYKFGKILVEATDNAQGLYYAAAFSPLAPKSDGVTFHIVQPQIDNFDSVFFSNEDIAAFREVTAETEEAILGGDLTFTPSDHCKFCAANPHSRGSKAKPYCPAMMKLLYPPNIDAAAALQ